MGRLSGLMDVELREPRDYKVFCKGLAIGLEISGNAFEEDDTDDPEDPPNPDPSVL